MTGYLEILLSEFGLRTKEVFFDFTLAQLEGLVEARVERNEEAERKMKRKGQEKSAPRGTVRDLKMMFG